MPKKIGILGYGYWGKILHSNLKTLNTEIIIHDPPLGLDNKSELDKCSHIFIATTADRHAENVLQFLSEEKHVFCEKPLCMKKHIAYSLFSTAKKKKLNLFVDWTFMFNDAVNYIKKIYEQKKLGEIRSITMNRLNSGPERHDVSAKWDLSCHDVSILQYIFNQFPNNIHWTNKKRNKKSFQDDTCVGLLEYPQFDAIIHSSWAYSKKDRKCVFEFDGGIVDWDDSTNRININGKNTNFIQKQPPLMNAINCFFDGNFDHEKITIDITEILDHGEK